MKTEFTPIDGSTVTLEVVTGAVMDARSQHVTSVHQGAAVPLANGVMLPGAIHSETNVHETVWLRLETGEERPFKLKNLQVPMLPGQRVSILLGGPVSSDLQHCFGIKNHNSGQKNVSVETVGDELKAWGLTVKNDTQSLLLISGICAILLAASFGSPGANHGEVSGEGIVAGLVIGSVGGLIGSWIFIRPFWLGSWAKRVTAALEAKGHQMLDEVSVA